MPDTSLPITPSHPISNPIPPHPHALCGAFSAFCPELVWNFCQGSRLSSPHQWGLLGPCS